MKAVIYARYSSDNQREESIEGQLRECKEYAERNGILVLQSYIDRALSAKTDNRPEFQRMIRDSAKGLFDTVLVWKLDRFARNRYDSAHYKSQLRKNGVKVVSATESIADGPEGIILESMLEGMAEYYSAELAQKVNRGMRENALRRFDFTGQFEDNRIMGLQPYENLTNCTAVRICFELKHFSLQKNSIKKIIDTFLLQCRDAAVKSLSTPFLRDKPKF